MYQESLGDGDSAEVVRLQTKSIKGNKNFTPISFYGET